jgi:hypothetical protein
MMAGIQALVNQKWGIRAGNPNPTYYAIANAEFGASGNSACYSINQPPTAAAWAPTASSTTSPRAISW